MKRLLPLILCCLAFSWPGKAGRVYYLAWDYAAPSPAIRFNVYISADNQDWSLYTTTLTLSASVTTQEFLWVAVTATNIVNGLESDPSNLVMAGMVKPTNLHVESVK